VQACAVKTIMNFIANLGDKGSHFRDCSPLILAQRKLRDYHIRHRRHSSERPSFAKPLVDILLASLQVHHVLTRSGHADWFILLPAECVSSKVLLRLPSDVDGARNFPLENRYRTTCYFRRTGFKKLAPIGPPRNSRNLYDSDKIGFTEYLLEGYRFDNGGKGRQRWQVPKPAEKKAGRDPEDRIASSFVFGDYKHHRSTPSLLRRLSRRRVLVSHRRVPDCSGI